MHVLASGKWQVIDCTGNYPGILSASKYGGNKGLCSTGASDKADHTVFKGWGFTAERIEYIIMLVSLIRLHLMLKEVGINILGA